MANTVFASLESIVGKDWEKEREKTNTMALSPSSSSSSSSSFSPLKSSAARKSMLLGEENQNPNVLMQTIKRRVIDSRRDLVPSDKEFFAIASQCKSYGKYERNKLTFDEYKSLRDNEVIPVAKRYFSASIFLKLPKDSKGLIEVEDFLGILQRTVDVETALLGLLQHSRSSTVDGYITENEMERYILEMLKFTAHFASMEPMMIPFYVFTACRKFFFFLDPHHTRKVVIKKMALSTVMDELLFLRRFSQYEADMDAASFQAQLRSNWFSVPSATEVYGRFIALDTTRSGSLTKAELRAYTGGKQINFTQAAVDRIFEETITYSPDNGMDFKTFLDLVIALESLDTKQSLQYFFRILDVTNCGKITPMSISYFYSDIQKGLQEGGWDSPTVEDIRGEIYDMAGINEADGITFADMVKCGQGRTICTMLLDVTGFWQYDNRESLLQEPEDDQQGPVNTAAETTRDHNTLMKGAQLEEDDDDYYDDEEFF